MRKNESLLARGFVSKIEERWLPETPGRNLDLTVTHWQIDPISKDSAEVFIYFKSKSDKKFTYHAKGTKARVYREALGLLPEINVNDFNKTYFERTAFYNSQKKEPKKDIEDLGIYGYLTPAEILTEKLKIQNTTLSVEQLGELAELDISTVYKHIKGEREITRNQAIKYANILGCDPADILFPPARVKVWGKVDLLSHVEGGDVSFVPGEIIPQFSNNETDQEYVLCPRDIYRPDVKAIQVVSENSYLNNCILFYYSEDKNNPNCLNKLCVIGEEFEETDFNPATTLYYVGILQTSDGTNKLTNPDPFAANVLKDSGMNNPTLIRKNIKPKFTTPVVAIVDTNKLDKSPEIWKNHSQYLYLQNKKAESMAQQVGLLKRQNEEKDKKLKELTKEKIEKLKEFELEIEKKLAALSATVEVEKKFRDKLKDLTIVEFKNNKKTA